MKKIWFDYLFDADWCALERSRGRSPRKGWAVETLGRFHGIYSGKEIPEIRAVPICDVPSIRDVHPIRDIHQEKEIRQKEESVNV
jgi:hypothetical protein